MSYCFNLHCQRPENADSTTRCTSCDSSLILSQRYRAIAPLGQGGFGRTYLAEDISLPNSPRCVIKQFVSPARSQTADKLFEEEARRLKELGTHPQIPTFIDYIEQSSGRYIVQEYINGCNLEEELLETGAFNETKIRDLLIALLPVLEFIHSHQVIHRDIKPANIIRRERDRSLVLVDFGAAKRATQTELAKTGTTIGSAGYAAPEQVSGKVTFASDLYSLGVTCLHLLTQVEPFELFSYGEDRWVWRDFLPQPISSQLERGLTQLVAKATTKRYLSAADALAELNAPSFHQHYQISNDLVINADVQTVALEKAITYQIEKRRKYNFNLLVKAALISVPLGVLLVVSLAPVVSVLLVRVNSIFRNLFQQSNNVDAIGVRGISTQLIAICGSFLALSTLFSFFQGIYRIHQGEEIGEAMSLLMGHLVFIVGGWVVMSILLS
ncbi:serine/threonine protein kinase [Chroococcidiopsis sp. FACHB-1243]|nr:serine/threonine protein kinase [Chroococcidiopsis sp. [FACHB-1243]]